MNDYLQELDRRDLPVVCEYAVIPDAPADSNFLLAAQRIMEDNNLGMPSEIDEALDLYITLVSIIEQVLWSRFKFSSFVLASYTIAYNVGRNDKLEMPK